jgi:endo-alpha-N-acetylgalactosaminidase
MEYLSDLKPASYRHIPFLQLTWPYHADRSVAGAALRAGGKLYAKGLGMHSPARITYDLDGPYKRFDAEVAIDAEAGPRGSVVVRVFTDGGDGVWQEKARSEILRGGQPAVPISVDLAGAKRISLLVDFADRGDEQDHVDWLNARLVR